MQIQKPIPPALFVHAERLSGPYPERYAQILDLAFREHQLILNAAQLRKVVGGGSQSTAQQAIEQWREKLHLMVGTRLNVGPDVPAEITAAFESAVLGVWSKAREVAAQTFEEERSALQRRLDEAQAQLETLRLNHAAAIAERDALLQELAQTRQAAESATAARDAASVRADAHAREAESLRTQLAALSQQQTDAELRHQQALAALRTQHQDRLRDLSEAHRRELAGLQHATERAVGALQNERKALVAERDTAVAQRAESDIARARAERDADQARQAAEAARLLRQDSAQALQRLQDELGAARERHAAELADARARAMDLAPLLGWMQAGCPPAMDGLDDRQRLVAQAVLQAVSLSQKPARAKTNAVTSRKPAAK